MLFLSSVDVFIQIGISLVVVFFTLLFIFSTAGVVNIYNTFHKLQQSALASLSNIGNQMQRRYDMLLSLAQTVKTYNAHEYNTLKDTISSRKFNANANPQEQHQQITDMQDSMIKILATIEAYPNILASELHRDFMAQNANIESRIQESRDYYNNVVRQYNTKCLVFPNNIVARVFRFRTMNFLSYGSQTPFEPRKVYAEF